MSPSDPLPTCEANAPTITIKVVCIITTIITARTAIAITTIT
jgi:hypothetical protein